MNKIFCLETEWIQNKHDLKSKPSALSLLEFLENSNGTPFIFRQVATASDFEYYINHLTYDTYNSYDIIYLCFHGCKYEIEFANKESLDLMQFALEHKDIFKGKTIHFGCCSTLKMEEEDIATFKKLTGARIVTGYKKSVPFLESFVFELGLLNLIVAHPDYGAHRLQNLLTEVMPIYTERFNFVSY